MSVIVTCMKMPERCETCDLICDDDSGLEVCCCTGEVVDRKEQARPRWCPLRPLSEKHGRLISADEAYDRIMEQEGGNYIDMDGVGMGLDECRTIVEAEGE